MLGSSKDYAVQKFSASAVQCQHDHVFMPFGIYTINALHIFPRSLIFFSPFSFCSIKCILVSFSLGYMLFYLLLFISFSSLCFQVLTLLVFLLLNMGFPVSYALTPAIHFNSCFQISLSKEHTGFTHLGLPSLHLHSVLTLNTCGWFAHTYWTMVSLYVM